MRAGLAAVMALRLAVGDWSAGGRQPVALFEPVAVVAWLSRPPSPAILVLVQWFGIGAASAVAALGVVGLRRHRSSEGGRTGLATFAGRAGFAVAWAALAFVAGVASSSGKVLHNEILLLLAGAPFLLVRHPDPEDPSSLRWGWPPRASLAVVATVYALSGIQKLRHSGLAWVTSDNMAWVLRDGATGTRTPFPEFTGSLAGLHWLPHLLAAGALLVELGAPVLLWRARTRPVFVVLVAGLHLGIWVTLGLDYSAWFLTVAAVAVPLSRRTSSGSLSGDGWLWSGRAVPSRHQSGRRWSRG